MECSHPPENIDACIRETVDWFKSHGAPFFFWWTGPGTAPADLARRLLSHGFVDLEGQSNNLAPGIQSSDIGAPGMAADLYKTNEEVLEKVPHGLEINDVQNETDLQDFKRVLIDGYEMPLAMAEGWVQFAHKFGIGKTPWRLVLGRLNGAGAVLLATLMGAFVYARIGFQTVEVRINRYLWRNS